MNNSTSTGPALAGAPNVARGGKVIYGAPIGILMLEARFARIPGDMGNAATWPFPVLYHVIRGADPERVVMAGAEGLLPAFIAGARELVDLGVEGITTNCGFLSIFQRQIAEAVDVPVATSSMMQVPWVQAILPRGRRPGILTISRSSLTHAHLDAIGVDRDTPVIGAEGGEEFFRVIVKGEKPDLDVELARRDLVGAARELVSRHPDVGAVVLECTNMTPYASFIQEAVGLPVYDIYSMVNWFHAALRPRRFHAVGTHQI